MNPRRAVIGYATFWVGRRVAGRVAERMVRRHVKRRISRLLGGGRPAHRQLRRRLPLVGAVAALAAAAAVVLTRQRG